MDERELTPLTVQHSTEADLTRRKGQGNGIRIHAVLFGVLSVVALVSFVILIGTASARM